jgi:hypothetical protein
VPGAYADPVFATGDIGLQQLGQGRHVLLVRQGAQLGLETVTVDQVL